MPRSAAPGAENFVPAGASLPELQDAARGCQGCHLYQNATQTVFGEGNPAARVMLVGEQPGDQEDRQGRPFVGPAGRILDQALAEASIDRSTTYVTNAVKHFKFEQTGKRRIHQAPNRTEIVACRPWLWAELDVLQPEVLVCLGATAGKAVFGPSFRVTELRGKPLYDPVLEGRPGDGLVVVATIHPSAVLRAQDQDATYAGLVADLQVVSAVLG